MWGKSVWGLLGLSFCIATAILILTAIVVIFKAILNMGHDLAPLFLDAIELWIVYMAASSALAVLYKYLGTLRDDMIAMTGWVQEQLADIKARIAKLGKKKSPILVSLTLLGSVAAALFDHLIKEPHRGIAVMLVLIMSMFLLFVDQMFDSEKRPIRIIGVVIWVAVILCPLVGFVIDNGGSLTKAVETLKGLGIWVLMLAAFVVVFSLIAPALLRKAEASAAGGAA